MGVSHGCELLKTPLLDIPADLLAERPRTVPRIEAAFFMVTDPRLQQLVSDAI